jgi:uncharacterized membrane protein YbhN (UPF0104 family)
MMLVSGIPTLPPVFKRLVRWLGVGRWKIASEEQLSGIGYRLMLAGWLLTAGGWVLLGMSLWAVLCAMGCAPGEFFHQLPIYMASVALATVLGFLSFVPGGIGVREAALTETLRIMIPRLGGAPSLIAAVFLRLVWLVAELLISAILLGFAWRMNRGQGADQRLVDEGRGRDQTG